MDLRYADTLGVMLKIKTLVFALALSALTVIGCTPTARQTATNVATDVQVAAGAAPVGCQFLAVGSPSAVGVCGTVAADVSAVAALVKQILASLPPVPPAMADAAPAYGSLKFRGVTVIAPMSVASQIKAGLPAH